MKNNRNAKNIKRLFEFFTRFTRKLCSLIKKISTIKEFRFSNIRGKQYATLYVTLSKFIYFIEHVTLCTFT